MSIDTKDRLLDAAETLFAEKGFAATSMRDITALAEANLASINYHFGSKEALLEAVFQRRVGPINEARLELLDRYEDEAGGKPVELTRLVAAFLAPPFRHMRQQGDAARRIMQLVGRVHGVPGPGPGEIFIRQFETAKRRFRAAFAAALPKLDATELERRIHFLIGSMAHTFAWCSAVDCLDSHDSDDDAVLRSLIRFGVAGLKAPEKLPNLTIPEPVEVAR